MADALSRDHIVDAIELNQCFAKLSPAEIRKEQAQDVTLAREHNNNARSASPIRDAKRRILVPQQYRLEILKSTHDLAHAGVESYAWPDMKKDVTKYVQNCARCQA